MENKSFLPFLTSKDADAMSDHVAEADLKKPTQHHTVDQMNQELRVIEQEECRFYNFCLSFLRGFLFFGLLNICS